MPDRPNILIVMADQHSPDIIGAAGNADVHTPHLDRLADEGVLCSQAYCNNPICVPSRMSFLTGQTTQQIECWSLSDTMRSDLATWPVMLGAAGYDTAMSGRMHCWYPDKHFGFHERLCGDKLTRLAQWTYDIYRPGTQRDRVLSQFTDVFYQEFRNGRFGVGENKVIAADRETTDEAVRYIQQRESNATPFALCVGYFSPHTPFTVPAEMYERYANLDVDPTELDPLLPDFMQDFARHSGADEPFPAELQIQAVRAYYALVTYLDGLVGEMLDALEATGQLDNTLVVYTSDHGEMLGRRGLWYKNQLLEPSIRTPLIARLPGRVRQGEREDAVVSLLDIHPTLSELAGQEPWPEAAGDSLVPLLAGTSREGFDDRPVFVEYADFGIGQPAACIRRRHLKLIRVRNYAPVLYDLAADPEETRNVYADPEYAGEVARLESDLAKHWDPEDTWRRVVRNQERVDLIRASRNLALERAGDDWSHLSFDP